MGIQLWITQTNHPRFGQLLIRVGTDDPIQILITSMVIAKDVVGRGRLDNLDVRAIGNWYGADVDNMLEPIAYAAYSSPPDIPGREDWSIEVAPGIPTPQELTVLRTWRRLAPPEYFKRTTIIYEGEDPLAELRQRTNKRVAQALNMTADEVAAVILNARIQPTKESMQIDVATDAGCRRADPGLICIDQRQLKEPNKFPDPIRVIDEACAHSAPTKHGTLPVLCEVGKPYF